MLLWAGQSGLARKYLLSQMEGLSLAFDSEELLQFMEKALTDKESAVRRQALYSLSRFLEGYLGKRYAVSSEMVGAFTNVGFRPEELAARPAERPMAPSPENQAALLAARPLVTGFLAVLKDARGWDRVRAVLALGQFGLAASRSWLAGEMSGPAPRIEVGLAYAEVGGSAARATILEAVTQHGLKVPDLFLLLPACPPEAAFDLLMDSIPKTDAVGRMNLARALGELRGVDTAAAYRRLRQLGEGWVEVAAMTALEQLADPALLPLVREVYDTAKHRMIRLQAVRTAGSMRGQDAIDFCFEAVVDKERSIGAMALESLVRLKAPPKELRRMAAPLLGSRNLKARVAACLVVLSPDDATRSESLQQLLLSDDPLRRLEAAYCLGYLQSQWGLALLGTLAHEDPSSDVRRQAVKALSKYPAKDSLELLVPLLSGDDRRIVLTTARVLARYEDADAVLVADSLRKVLEGQCRAGLKATLYWVLGMLGGRTDPSSVRGHLEAGLAETDPQVVSGLVEAWILVGSGGERKPEAWLERMSTGGDGRLRARALLALWNSGQVGAIDQLGSMLVSGDAEQVSGALESALEIGVLNNCETHGQRFPTLRDQLATRAFQPTHAAAVGEEELSMSRPAFPIRAVDEEQFAVRRAAVGLPEPSTASVSGLQLESEALAEGNSTGLSPEVPPSRPMAAMHMPSTPVARVAKRVDPGQLRTFLAQPNVRGSQEIGAGQSEALGSFHDVDGASRLLGRVRQAVAKPAARVAIACSAVFLLLAVLLLRPASEALVPPPLPSGAAGHLWVSMVSGSCNAGHDPLKPEDVLKPADRFESHGEAELILTTPEKNRVVMQGESHCTFDGVGVREAGKKIYRFSDPDGNVLFEFRHDEPHLELVFATARVRATGAWLLVSHTAAGRTVTVMRGEATLVSHGDENRLKTNQGARID